MSKDRTKNLVGQPIFKQVMKILPREQFDFLVGQQGSDRDNEVFKLYYFALIKYFEPLLSVSRKEKISFEKFLQHLNPSKGSMLVFDKAYNYYRQFAEWTDEQVYFVCRLKDNARAEVQETLFEKPLSKDEHGVYRVDH